MKSAQMLLAVDQSPESTAATRVGAQLARGLDARVAIVNVSRAGVAREIAEAPERFAQKELAKVGIEVKVMARGGDAADEIVEAARDLGADLLVMGSRGRSPVTGLLLGSVSQDVVARATCPVLLVRANADTTRSPQRILLAIEGVHGSAPLVAITTRLAKALKASVTVVHVSYPRGEDLERSLFHAQQTHGEQAVAAAVAHLRKSTIEATSMQLVARTGVSRALAACADSIDADLIVMGSHGPRRRGEGAGTELSTAVSRRTRRPVLVTPETQPQR
jgi:nucleotide-binding universal stress UspA family protein